MIKCLFMPTSTMWRFSAETRGVVRDICNSADPELHGLLEGLPKYVQVIVKPGKRVLPNTGEMGSAVIPHCVVWTVDGSRPGGVAEVAKRQLRSTLFHEFHHLARGWVKSNYMPGTPLIHAATCEGLATAFERDFGGRHAPWADYPSDVASWVEELMHLPLTASYRNWMFQHPDGRRWIGYRAGTFIVDRAIASSGQSSADLVRTPTSEILRMAGFILSE